MKSVIRVSVCLAALWGGAAMAKNQQEVTAYGGAGEEEITYRPEHKGAETGPYVLLGGGVNGFTGANAPGLNPGLAYGAQFGFKPSRGLGMELGYSGGLSDISRAGAGGTSNGADVVRNGGQAALTLGLPTRLQPYLMAGVGIQDYNVRGVSGDTRAFGYKDDFSGYVPAGVGLRYNAGKVFTADARVDYNVPFSQNFAPSGANGFWDGRYEALLQLGGTY